MSYSITISTFCSIQRNWNNETCGTVLLISIHNRNSIKNLNEVFICSFDFSSAIQLHEISINTIFRALLSLSSANVPDHFSWSILKPIINLALNPVTLSLTLSEKSYFSVKKIMCLSFLQKNTEHPWAKLGICVCHNPQHLCFPNALLAPPYFFPPVQI